MKKFLFNKANLLLLIIVFIGLLIRLYKIDQLMIFIGDQGWFYESAKNFLTGGNFPLVGITSSHTWLHQGPLWTYILMVIFLIFGFNPLIPGIFTALFSVFTILFVYKVGNDMFGKEVGLVSSFLFSLSPLVIINSRFPFDPSIIPFFAILLIYSVFKWVNKDYKYFPIAIFSLAILYNLELSTIILSGVFAIIFFWGLFKRKEWISGLVSKKIILSSLVLFVIPMLPIFIYDVFNGFKQTIIFAGWLIYHSVFFLVKKSTGGTTIGETLSFFVNQNSLLIFLPSAIISLVLLFSSWIYLLYKIISTKVRKIEDSYFLFFLFLVIPTISFILNKVPSEAYLPVFFPIYIIVISSFFTFLVRLRFMRYPIIIVIIFIGVFNSYFLISQNYLSGPHNTYKSISQVKEVSEKVISETKGNSYNIIIKGEGSQWESSKINFEYYIWWVSGKEISKDSKYIFIVEQKNGIITVRKK